MPATVQTTAPARVSIGAPRGSVAVGSGRSRIVLAAPAAVTLQGRAPRVTLSGAPRLAVQMGRQGIAGPPGPGSEIELYEAAITLGGHRAVALDENGRLVYASALLGIPAIGIVRDATSEGAEVAVYRAGRVGGFTGLTPGAVYYLAADGLLALTPPEGGELLQPIGTAASATELLVEPDYPTFL